MKRSRLKSKPRQRGTDRELAYRWFVAVTRPKGKPARCVECGRTHPQMQAHHVTPQQVLRREFPHGAYLESLDAGRWWPVARGVVDMTDLGYIVRSLQELLWTPANGVPLCPTCHERHENASHRVALDKLPLAAIRFARELGQEHRLSERFYARG